MQAMPTQQPRHGLPGKALCALRRSKAGTIQMRSNLRTTFGMFPFGQFEEMGKQNIAMFERALKMLSPYGGRDEKPAASEPAPAAQPEDPRLKRLETQIEALQQQLDKLGRDRS